MILIIAAKHKFEEHLSVATPGPAMKLKNLSDVLLGALENDFQLVTQKESYEIASDFQNF